MIVLWSFSFAVLAGFGFDVLRTLIQEKAKKRIIGVLFLLGLFLCAIWFAVVVLHLLPVDKSVLARRNLMLPTGMFLLTVCVILAATFLRYKKAFLLVSVLIILLTSIDSFRFATKWMPFDERKLVYPDIPVIQALKKQIGNDRVFGNLGTQVESYYGIASLEGYDPLYIKRYGEFIRSSVNGNYQDAERSVVRLDRRGKYTERVLDLLGVHIIFHPKSDTFTEWAFPVWANKGKYTMFYEDEKFQLFTNNTALPRVKLFYQYAVIKESKALLKKFYTEDFDYRNILLLEEDPQITNNKEQPLKSQAKITSYTANKVVVAVESDAPALLFLSDSYYPNWKAKVNGKDEKIYRTDYAFRSVRVPKGKSVVEFYYRGLL